MLLTVAICTYNRAVLLAQTLQRMTVVRRPSGVEVEWIVVDNASPDDTAVVAQSFAQALKLRVVREEKRGLSNARNRAIAEASGDYVCWTDDDVLVSDHWLEGYVAAIRAHPDADVFGGPVEPWFPSSPPPWLQEGIAHVGPAYAIVDHGADEVRLTHDRTPFGANMLFRMAAQRRHLYDPTLGRTPESMLSGEETTVVRAILKAGGTGWWVPAARVRHFIPPDRQTHAYLRRYYEAQGALVAVTEDRGVGARWFGRARYMYRQLAEARLRQMTGLVRHDPNALAQFRLVAIATGYFRAYGDPATSAVRSARASAISACSR